ncbi:MAG: cofactor-independent phosphoglycerate mutase [Bacteroidales bacterium]|nr:cofactor-independent phosphoglycerate mutase [Bacteroidales bacterium]
MKYLIILGDGMADNAVPSLNNMTPLQYAFTPNIDKMAREGAQGRLVTVPKGFHPGSEIANLGVLGYDVNKVFEGRGSLEAASMGIDIEPGEMAMRCNLICVEEDILKNHSAGHITTEEAKELILFLDEKLGNERVSFYPGVSYRHLLIIKNANKNFNTIPPHDVPGKPFMPLLPSTDVEQAKETVELIDKLILDSQKILSDHPINKKRISLGKDPANSIWPWSPGYHPSMTPLKDIYPIKTGAVISAVDLIHGIGVYAGLDKIEVEGATGLYTTNYEGKTKAAIEQLKEKDFVFLHIEASDEAGHEGDALLKVKTIEYLDSRVVGPILKEIDGWNEDVTVALLPDHPTPVSLFTHTSDPVPFLIWGRGVKSDNLERYDEETAKNGSFGLLKNDEFIKLLFSFK